MTVSRVWPRSRPRSVFDGRSISSRGLAAKRRIEFARRPAVHLCRSRGRGRFSFCLHGYYRYQPQFFPDRAIGLGGYRLIIPDLGGHGGSMHQGRDVDCRTRPRMSDCLGADRLAIRPVCAIVGHSMGAMIADRYCRAPPGGGACIDPAFGKPQAGLWSGQRQVARGRYAGSKTRLVPTMPSSTAGMPAVESVDTAFLRHLRREAAAMPMTTMANAP